MKALHLLVFSMLCTGLVGCASIKVHEHVEEVELEGSGHTEWWNDSIPRVLVLPRVCSGKNPVYRIPGPTPSVYLEVDRQENIAKFHDISPTCVEAGNVSDSLRIVVSRWKIPLGGADSVQLDGRFGPLDSGSSSQDHYDNWYALGTLEGQDDSDATKEGRDNRYICTYGAKCMREGANMRWLSDTGVVQLAVVERLHPGQTPWAVRERRLRSMGYLVSIPVDIVLSPVYLVGGIVLYFGLRDFNPWH